MNFFKSFKTIGNLIVIPQFSNIKYSSQLVFFNKFYSTSSKYDLDLQIHGKSLKSYILALEKEYQSLAGENSAHNSRLTEIQPIINILEDRKKIVDNINNLNEFLKSGDDELIKQAKEEKDQFESKINQLDETLLATLVPYDSKVNFDSLILEVQAGVGGQEAMLFAKEIFHMYFDFATYKGWDVQIAEYLISDKGGIRSASILVSGNSAYQCFRHEAGIHRVQRVPTTEKSGRMHTSTVAVAILPQPSDIEVNISSNDLKVETKRASGAGGQHVNKTESAIRIVHLPTGIAVECQEDRSQIKNRKVAMARLRAILYQKQLEAQITNTAETRKTQVRNKNRNEKIRTYNFKDDRITDHRLGLSVYNLSEFFEGSLNLNNLIEKLEENYRMQSLLDIVKNTECK